MVSRSDAQKDVSESRVFCVTGDGSVILSIPKEALVKILETEAVLRAPSGTGFDGYRYNIPRGDVRWTREYRGRDMYGLHVKFPPKGTVTLRKCDEETEIPASDLVKAVKSASDDDFLPATYEIEIPRAAVCALSAVGVRFRIPEGPKIPGGFVTATTSFVNAEKSDSEKIVLSVPEEKNLTVRTRDGDFVTLPAGEVAAAMSSAKYDSGKKWVSFVVPKEAFVKRYDKCTLLKLPCDGVYDDFAYYLPNGMVDATQMTVPDCGVKLTVPREMPIEIRSLKGETRKISTEKLCEIIKGRPGECYRKPRAKKESTRPREGRDDFPGL